MAKRKGTKDNGQKKRDEGQWQKEKGRRTMAKRKGSFGHCPSSLFFWPLSFVPFLLAIVLRPFSFGHCPSSLFFNGQKKRDEGQWPKEKGRRTMAKRKGMKDNSQKKRDEGQ
jgi:hypothetical protein